jgi:hypothetical protein
MSPSKSRLEPRTEKKGGFSGAFRKFFRGTDTPQRKEPTLKPDTADGAGRNRVKVLDTEHLRGITISPKPESKSAPVLHQTAPQAPAKEPEITVSDDVIEDLCDRCRRLEFGEYEDGNASSAYSRQIWKRRDLRQRCCRLSALVEPFCDGTTLAQEIRYIPPSTVSASDGTAVSDQSGQTKQIVYFRQRFGPKAGMTVFVRRFAPIPRATAILTEDLSNLGTRNISLAKKWLEFCLEHHGMTCGKTTGKTLPGLKVINCITRQICPAIPHSPYLALSYVWGNQIVDAQSSLSELPTTLPKTIEDAMLVAIGLKIPYLWIDRYCIDQSNEKEKHTMVTNMDMIYARAELTLIAGAGFDPHFGLPGVSTTIRNNVARKTISSDGALISYPGLYGDFGATPWASRGWTYQEMLLSRRRLVFCDSQMFFHCCKQDFYEAFSLHSPHVAVTTNNDPASEFTELMQLGCPEANLRHYKPESRVPENGIGTSAKDIYLHLRDYNEKTLSYPTDKLNAFEGIFSAFRRSMPGYAHHFWGIPILNDYHPKARKLDWQSHVLSSFLAGLAWTPRSKGKDEDVWRQRNWPSWTWSSLVEAQLMPDYGIDTHIQRNISVTLTHRKGTREDLCKFAIGPHTYTDYHPWIDLKTWVLRGVSLVRPKESPGIIVKVTHPSLSGPLDGVLGVNMDVRYESIDGKFIAIYIGTWVLEGAHDHPIRFQGYLVAKPVANGSSFRRVGIMSLLVKGLLLDESDPEKLIWLPGPNMSRSFNAWKLETVRLV